MSVVCLCVVFVGGLTLGVSPLSVAQLLWINMIMDTLAAVALATEPPTRVQVQQKQAQIIQPAMWRNIAVQGAY